LDTPQHPSDERADLEAFEDQALELAIREMAYGRWVPNDEEIDALRAHLASRNTVSREEVTRDV
jgi:hypothetical protein